jgi:hypothetical protein
MAEGVAGAITVSFVQENRLKHPKRRIKGFL